MNDDITVVITSIPPRADMLLRAIGSVLKQTLAAAAILVEVDHDHEGPAVVRNRGLAKVTTEYVAFLDDDDEMRPGHLAALRRTAEDANADLVYPWFDVVSSRPTPGWDPLGRFGMDFDPAYLDEANYIPVTVLARTKAITATGGFVDRNTSGEGATCEDWGCWLAMRDNGAKIVHLPERTWIWNWHMTNTSGQRHVW